MADRAAGADRLIYRLQRCFAAVEARKAEILAPFNLLPAHYALLMNIKAQPGVIAADLARLLAVTPQNITGLVNRMGDRDLIQRRPLIAHPHVIELHLTDSGIALIEQADDAITTLEQAAITALGPTASSALAELLDDLRAGIKPCVKVVGRQC